MGLQMQSNHQNIPMVGELASADSGATDLEESSALAYGQQPSLNGLMMLALI